MVPRVEYDCSHRVGAYAYERQVIGIPTQSPGAGAAFNLRSRAITTENAWQSPVPA